MSLFKGTSDNTTCSPDSRQEDIKEHTYKTCRTGNSFHEHFRHFSGTLPQALACLPEVVRFDWIGTRSQHYTLNSDKICPIKPNHLCGQGLRAGCRRRLPLYAKVYTSEDARHRRRAALRPGAALLRSPRSSGQGRTADNRPRVLRTALGPMASSSARTAPCSTNASESRTEGHGTIHPRRFSGTLTSTSRSTTSSAATKATASRAAYRLRRYAMPSEEETATRRSNAAKRDLKSGRLITRRRPQVSGKY